MSIAKMKELEKSVIERAVERGHMSPFDDNANDDKSVLFSEDREGNKLRRFIKDLRLVRGFEELTTSENVREIDVNSDVVKEMQKWWPKEKLKHPVMIDANGPGRPRIQSGNHRFVSWPWKSKQGPLPAFELTPWYDEATGQLTTDTKKAALASLHAAIAANPKPKGTGYTYKDQGNQIVALLKVDPTLEEAYPGGFDVSCLPAKYYQGCYFDKALEYLNRSEERSLWRFSNVPTCGKIMAIVKDPDNKTKDGIAAKIRAITENTIIESIVNAKWTCRYDSEKGFLAWDEYLNEKTGNHVIFGNTQGENWFNTNFRNIYTARVDNKEMPEGFDLFLWIHNVTKLNFNEHLKVCRKALERVARWNKLLAHGDCPQIKNVLIPKQLIDRRNKDIQLSGPNFVQAFDNMFPKED